MLFFRSEARAHEWCAARGYRAGPLVTVPQLWRLATAWYATRLEAEARRPQPDEAIAIFASLGLAGDFWDPTSDRF